jgi:hypothetical protein
MYQITSWFLILALVLQPVASSIFAIGDQAQSDLLSQLTLQRHFEESIRKREHQKYELELEMETLRSIHPDHQVDRSSQERISQIQNQMRVLDRSLSSNQENLLGVRKRIDGIRRNDLHQNTSLRDEELSVALGAGNAANILNATHNASQIPGHLRRANPQTGVLSTANGKVTAIERWNDGKFYKVTRYADGANKGKFAPGGRQEISKADVRKMGSQLKGQQVEGLKTSLNSSQARIDSLRQQVSSAKDPAARAKLQQKLGQVEKVQSELKSELKRSQAKPVTNFIKSGLSFAAMSVAITGGYNLIQQAIEQDGDITRLDYKKAFQFMTQEEFYTGTAGSFTGGMLGAALTSFLPGPFKVLGAIAGASVGHQFGTGGWKSADWAQVGAQTIGSTIGFFLGAFIGSFLGPFAPIAIIAFSILGSWVADKVLTWIRSAFTPGVSAFDLDEMRDSEYSQVEAFADMVPTEQFSTYDQFSESALREELWITYTNYKTLQESGGDFQSEEQKKIWTAELRKEWTRYLYIRNLLTSRKQAYFGEQTIIPQ